MAPTSTPPSSKVLSYFSIKSYISKTSNFERKYTILPKRTLRQVRDRRMKVLLLSCVVHAIICLMFIVADVSVDAYACIAKKARPEKVVQRSPNRDLLEKSGKNDDSEYVRVQDAVMGSLLSSSKHEDVTWVTHGSANHLRRAAIIADIWKGPMSVALFLWSEKDIEPTIKAIQCLRASYPLLKQHATFSFSYHRYIQQEESDWKFWNESCDTIDEALNRLSSGKENFLGTRTPYPISLMRNVARKSARTHFFTICDMDITPSIGLRTSFLQMVKKEGLLNKEDVLYIMPVFELQKEAPIPTNKLELRTLFQNGSARQFYATWSPLTQGKTDYSRWFALPPSDGVRIAYEVEWGFLYEPYFILTSSAPDYYEGIKEITYDRGSYACELSARGWRFFVLDNAFALHDGFKASDTFEYVRSKFLRKELSKNAINHRIYRAELLAKYGSKAKKCSSLYYRTMEVFLVLGGNI